MLTASPGRRTWLKGSKGFVLQVGGLLKHDLCVVGYSIVRGSQEFPFSLDTQ